MDEYSRLKVLVIEDNQMFKGLAIRMMPDCKKHSAATAREGLDMFKKLHPDITLLDIGLPDGNGLDILREMKAIMPRAFIVMFTQSRVSTDVETAIKNGAAGYICKPFSQKEIQQCFERYTEYRKTLEEQLPKQDNNLDSHTEHKQSNTGGTHG